MTTKKVTQIEKIDGLSADVGQEIIDALKQLVPEIFSDGKIDTEKLKRVVGENNVVEDERYRLEWAGKSEVFDEIAKRSACTLTLDEKRSSKDWEKSDNVFIEGENLEVLRMLQKAYHGKVKMIYIDPPYNTGKDFVYNDNFRMTEEEYCDDACNVDENGNIKKAMKLNSRDSGRFHSNWLSMMYPRLYLARNLLREDGVLFVSIDDNEVHNLRQIMSEILGEENFVAQFVWKTKKGAQGMQTANMIVANHEYIVAYAKSINRFKFLGIERSNETFSNPDNDERGPWKRQYLQRLGQGLPVRKIVNPETNKQYQFETPYTEEKLNLWIKEKRIIFPKSGEGYPARKEFLNEYENKQQLITDLGLYPTKSTTEQLYNLFNDVKIFTNPKPHTLLQNLILATVDSEDIILDFFAGSASLAHATMLQNAVDNIKRKFICVQMPEETPEGSEARKAGYEKISDIAIDRIKKASEKIKKEYPDFKGDLGVRVYKETDSNFPQWHARAFESNETLKQAMIDYSKASVAGSAYDRATEVLLKLGYALTTPLEEKKDYFTTPDGIALVLDSAMTIDGLRKVLSELPKTIVVLEKLFKKDEDKINFGLRCKESGVIFQTI